MDIYEQFLIHLEKAIQKAGNLKKLSQLSGISYATLYHWRARESAPSLDNIKPLLPFLEDFKFAPTEDNKQVIKNTSSNAKLKIVDASKSIQVPVVGEVGAGMPIELWDQEPIEYISIMPEYVKENLRVFKVAGDSMDPTIKKGAYVGVTPPTDMFLKEGRIYLCYNQPFGIVIKRLKPASGNKVLLLSDNPSYDPITISLEEYPKVVVGEVRWVMQSV